MADKPGRGRAKTRSRTVPQDFSLPGKTTSSATMGPPPVSLPRAKVTDSAVEDLALEVASNASLSTTVRSSGGSVASEGTSLHRVSRSIATAASSVIVTCPAGFDKRGKEGDALKVITNYYHMNEKSNFTLNQYRVDFQPVEDHTNIKKLLIKAHEKTLGSYIFDGHMMYKTELIPSENLELKSRVGADGVGYTINMRLVGVVNPEDAMYLQFYNIVMRKCMTLLQMEELGRHFYDRHASISFHEDRLELWPGFITAIRNHQCGTLLCAEVTHKVLRTSSVLEVIQSFRRPNMTEDRLREIIKKELIGTIVMTHYNRKTYRIDDIDFNTTPGSSFRSQDGIVQTYLEYYQKRYHISISSSLLRQPMLVSEPKQKDKNKGLTGKIYLVPSLCNCTGLTDDMRKNFPLMKRLSEHLHMDPLGRKKKLDEFMDKLRKTPDVQEELRNWNVDFNPNFIQAPARLFPKEKVYLGPADRPEPISPDDMADWTNQFRSRHVLVPKQLDCWVLFVPEQDAHLVEQFLTALKRMGQQIGINTASPLEVYDARARNLDPRVLKDTFAHYGANLSFVFFILPNNQLQKYADVKKICCLEFGVPCQCFLSKNMKAKSLNSICTKVMIQICAKMGGEPWSISVPLKKLMVLGFDVYHCPARKNESVGALVSTTSANLTRYFSTVSFHKDKSELSSNLALDMSKCLIAYFDSNNFLPDRVVLFRDGVGEGQINFVLEHEVQQIKLAINKEYSKRNMPEPKFSFIIVTKKINTRAIVESRGTFINPLPGTVIDDIITLPERYDFFLVAQSVRQGTVSPTSYNVIEDTSGFSADKMQRLAYKLCHMYFNWSGTVAVPAPCQYAHKLAYLTGVALAESAPLSLSHLLWYL